MMAKKYLTKKECETLMETLKIRFEKNMGRHKNIGWDKVGKKIINHPQKLWSLHQMEITGGEPDVIDYDKKTNEYVFYDCSSESPGGRRSICYDREGLESRKENRPKTSAIDMANEMGIKILNEEEYKNLQQLGNFDTKTSSWILTPDNIRTLGGALFADRRFNHVFIYHNTAQSYYGARGFRGSLNI